MSVHPFIHSSIFNTHFFLSSGHRVSCYFTVVTWHFFFDFFPKQANNVINDYIFGQNLWHYQTFIKVLTSYYNIICLLHFMNGKLHYDLEHTPNHMGCNAMVCDGDVSTLHQTRSLFRWMRFDWHPSKKTSQRIKGPLQWYSFFQDVASLQLLEGDKEESGALKLFI